MDIEQILKNEILRLSRINVLLEKVFPKTAITYKEPELIKQNTELMLKIYMSLTIKSSNFSGAEDWDAFGKAKFL